MRRRKSMSASAPARPAFHDPRLQEALEESAPTIEEFTARLDRLSADIKSLEAFLDKSAIRMAVRVKFAEEEPRPSRGRSWAATDKESPFGEFIAWDKGEPDRFRIVYYKVVRGEDYPEEMDRSVLIEAPLDIRVRARPALPDLLRKVSQAAALGEDTRVDAEGSADEGKASPQGTPPDDDIPF
jgi:hypothetical protein